MLQSEIKQTVLRPLKIKNKRMKGEGAKELGDWAKLIPEYSKTPGKRFHTSLGFFIIKTMLIL